MNLLRRVAAHGGHLARELAVWSRWLSERVARRRPLLVYLESDLTSGLLRARQVAPELRRLGWAVLNVPRQLERRQRDRLLRVTRPAVIVLQQCRHPLNDPDLLPASVRSRATVVLDVDDADWLHDVQGPRLDAVSRKVDLVIAGNRNVAEWVRERCPRVEVIWTTAAPAELPSSGPSRGPDEPTVITWAPSYADLTDAERALAVRVLSEVADTHSFELWVFGVHDRDLVARQFASLADRGVVVRLVPPLPYDRFLTELAGAAIGLNPLCEDENPFAAGKSFGKTLAYLTCAVAVVTTDTVDHPLFFEQRRNGVMCHEEAEWPEAIRWLLDHPAERARIGAAGQADAARRLTPAVAARRLVAALEQHSGVRVAAATTERS